MKIRLVSISIIFIFISLLVGCYNKVSVSYLDARVCPDFKIHRGNDEENLVAMRLNLKSVAEHFPGQELNGFVFFKDPISIEQFIQLAEKYGIKIGEDKPPFIYNSINFFATYPKEEGVESARLTQKLTQDHLELNGFQQRILKHEKKEIDLNSVEIISFRAYTKAKEFLKMWEENEGIIRGIGTTCTDISYVPLPTDPIKLNGQRLF